MFYKESMFHNNLESIEVFEVSSNMVIHLVGGTRFHKNFLNKHRYDMCENSKNLLFFRKKNKERNFHSGKENSTKFLFAEIVFDKGGQYDVGYSESYSTAFVNEDVEIVRKILRLSNIECVENIIDLMKSNFGKKNASDNFVRQVLRENKVDYIDLKISTISSYKNWIFANRNLRIIFSDKFILCIYGPIQGDKWNGPDIHKISYVTLPGMGSFFDTIMDCSLEGIRDTLLKKYVVGCINHVQWSINIAIEEGVREQETLIFDKMSHSEDIDLEIYWIINSKLGSAIKFVSDSLSNFRFKIILKDNKYLSKDQEVIQSIKRMEESISCLRKDVHENYHLLSSISQKKQFKIAEIDSYRSSVFQNLIGIIAIAFAFPSVVISLYGASSKGISGMPGEGSIRALVYIGCTSAIYVGVIFIVVAIQKTWFPKSLSQKFSKNRNIL